jgi:hypothetical protein
MFFGWAGMFGRRLKQEVQELSSQIRPDRIDGVATET